MTSHDAGDRRCPISDIIWLEVTWKWLKGLNTGIYCTFHFLQGWLAGGGSHITENDVTWPQVSGSDTEVTWLDQKSPGRGCRGPKTGQYCTVHFLQGCSLQLEAVTWQKMMSRDLRWAEVTRKWRDWTRSHLEGAVEGRKLAYTSHFLQGCSSQKAVTWQEMTSRDLWWPEVTRKWRHLIGSPLEVDVGRKLDYTVHFTSYKAVARRRRQSCDRKWVTWPKVIAEGGYHVTGNDITDLRRPEVTRKWHHLTGSHL